MVEAARVGPIGNPVRQARKSLRATQKDLRSHRGKESE
jgi:hypothetical protein